LLSIWLIKLGVKVIGASIDVVSSPLNFSVSMVGEGVDDRRIDVTDLNSVELLIQEVQPDFIFHLVSQA
jgi:hypothetical protein